MSGDAGQNVRLFGRKSGLPDTKLISIISELAKLCQVCQIFGAGESSGETAILAGKQANQTQPIKNVGLERC
jgi:hypothetical protein